MSRRILLALVGVLILLLGLTTAQAQTDDILSTTPLTITEMFNNVNALRQSQQRPVLTINSALTQAAQEQADYISQTGNYAHVHGSSSPTSRAMSAAYETTEWCCSENTHRTQIGKSAWEFWNLSRPHYYNMINPKWTEIGLAISNVGPWTGWVLVFGSGNQSAAPSESLAQSSTSIPSSSQIAVSTGLAPVSQTAGSYRVAWGDTLSTIARRYDVTISDLKTANGLASDLIYAGQMLIIPSGQGQALSFSRGTSTNLTTQITSPAAGAIMRPGFPIIGTARFDATQALYYKVEISGGQFGEAWVTIGDVHTASASNAQLEFLNVVQPGSYTLRLVIVGTDSNSVASTSVSFKVSG